MKRRSRSKWWGVLVPAALAIVGASCNLPTNSAAIQFAGSPTSNAGCAGPVDVAVYFTTIAGPPNHLVTRLTKVTRSKVSKEQNLALCTLHQLNLGPTEPEVTDNIATALPLIPEALDLLGQNSTPTATVEVDQPFLAIEPQQSEILAFGQIVYTMTHLPGVKSVQFDFNGKPYRQVVLPGGAIVRSGLVTRLQYCSIGPPNEGCPTPKHTTTRAKTSSRA